MILYFGHCRYDTQDAHASAMLRDRHWRDVWVNALINGGDAYRIRPYFFITSTRRGPGRPKIRMPSTPVMTEGAASIAFTTASSVASIVARNSGSIRSFGIISSLAISDAAPAPGLAVERARNKSPEPLLAQLPNLPRPIPTRRAIRSN